MINTIFQAAQNFCIHQIKTTYTSNIEVPKKRTLIAYIDINTQESKKHRIYLAGEEDFYQEVSKVFLEEDQSDEETLIDVALETTNLIVGSAKGLTVDGKSFNIETPHFIKIDKFDFEYDEIKTLIIKNKSLLMIASKELD